MREPTLEDDVEREAWALVLAHALAGILTGTPELSMDVAHECAMAHADRAIRDMRARLDASRLRAQISAHDSGDPLAGWPLCAVCGLSAPQPVHAPGLPDSHDYVPTEPSK